MLKFEYPVLFNAWITMETLHVCVCVWHCRIHHDEATNEFVLHTFGYVQTQDYLYIIIENQVTFEFDTFKIRVKDQIRPQSKLQGTLQPLKHCRLQFSNWSIIFVAIHPYVFDHIQCYLTWRFLSIWVVYFTRKILISFPSLLNSSSSNTYKCVPISFEKPWISYW